MAFNQIKQQIRRMQKHVVQRQVAKKNVLVSRAAPTSLVSGPAVSTHFYNWQEQMQVPVVISVWSASHVKTLMLWINKQREVISTQKTSHKHNNDLKDLLYSPGMQVNAGYINSTKGTVSYNFLGHDKCNRCRAVCGGTCWALHVQISLQEIFSIGGLIQGRAARKYLWLQSSSYLTWFLVGTLQATPFVLILAHLGQKERFFTIECLHRLGKECVWWICLGYQPAW